MQIGIVAKKIGLSVDAIRFYERNALLPHASRTAGGFLRFGESEIETLPFIRRVQGLGFTLNEVREFLELRQSRVQPCVPVRRRLKQKLNHVHRKLTDFQKLKHELRVALRSCNKELHKQSARCLLTHITTHFEFMTTNGGIRFEPRVDLSGKPKGGR